jgi:hypothetical protein
LSYFSQGEVEIGLELRAAIGCSTCAAARTETMTLYSEMIGGNASRPICAQQRLANLFRLCALSAHAYFASQKSARMDQRGRSGNCAAQGGLRRRRTLDSRCSHTDEGDPWCIVFNQPHHRVVLRIARIDRRYVVVVPLKGSSWKTTMKAVVDLAIAHISPAQAF